MSKSNNGANLGFENELWKMADKMRGHMDSGEYKHVVLGLIFLKYISDAFQGKYDTLKATVESDYTDPEDRDEYAAANIFWVPRDARWEKIQAEAKQPTIGKIIDDAMTAMLDSMDQTTSSQIVERAKSFVLNHYAEPITLDDIAGAAFTSKRNLTRVFITETGTTVTTFIQQARVWYACNQLRFTNKSCAQIAFESGFGSIQQFNRAFRKLQMVTPSYFREIMIAGDK